MQRKQERAGEEGSSQRESSGSWLCRGSGRSLCRREAAAGSSSRFRGGKRGRRALVGPPPAAASSWKTRREASSFHSRRFHGVRGTGVAVQRRRRWTENRPWRGSVNRSFSEGKIQRILGRKEKEEEGGGGGGREERRNPRAGVGAPGAALCRGGAAGGSTWGELGCNPLPAPLFRTKLGERPDRRWVGMELGQAQQAWPGLGLFFPFVVFFL